MGGAGYLAASSALIAVFAENLAHPVKLFGVQALVAAMILVLCLVEARVAEQSDRRCDKVLAKFWHFWRHWYPHLFFLFCFEELGKLVHLVTPGWQDAKLISFDQWADGVNPSLWLERFRHPVLNEFMQFAYFSYFVFLLILGGIFYYRRDRESYWGVMTYSAVGYVFGYVISIFFPVQSPWFTFAGMWHGNLTGGPFTALINLIEKCGRVRGAAFPSQHVAGAVAALWGACGTGGGCSGYSFRVSSACAFQRLPKKPLCGGCPRGMVTGTLGYVIGRWVMWREGARPSKSSTSAPPPHFCT